MFLQRLQREGFKLCDGLPQGVKEFLQHYPREALHVELSENFLKNPVSVLRRIEAAVGLSPYAWNETKLTENRWHVQLRPEVTAILRKQIRERCHAPIAE